MPITRIVTDIKYVDESAKPLEDRMRAWACRILGHEIFIYLNGKDEVIGFVCYTCNDNKAQQFYGTAQMENND